MADYGEGRAGTRFEMDAAAGILMLVVSLASVVFVGVLFVWAAKKDGEEDRALQSRLGTRRRSRLGR